MAKFCGNCRSEVSESASFCHQCGTAVAQQPKPMSFEGVANRSIIQQIGTVNIHGSSGATRSSQDSGGLLSLGNAALMGGNHEEALHFYNQAITLGPNNALTWMNRGLALNSLGRHQEALASFDKVLALDPNWSSAWDMRGWALLLLKRYQEALASYDNLLALKPDYAAAWESRGVALDKLGRHQEADESFKKSQDLLEKGT
jgi:superkiller protein 3